MRPSLALILALPFLALAIPARSQTGNCADHATVVTRLGENYGETRQSIGLTSTGNVIEVFASLDSGSWTITVTRPGGPTCLVAAGEAFQNLDEALPPEGPAT